MNGQADGSIIIDTELDDSGLEGGISDLSGKIAGWVGVISQAWGVFNDTVIATGSAFDEAFYPIAARTRMAKVEIDELKYAFRDLSFYGHHTAQAIAEAYSYVATEGQSVAHATELMTQSQKLAIATNTDLSTATNLLNLSLVKTGAEIYKAAGYVDIYSQIVATSGMSMETLQAAIIQVAPTMNQAGLSMEYVGGTLATLYNEGIKGIGAANGLNSIFQQLASPTRVTADAMKQLGLEMFDSQGAMRDFTDVMDDLIFLLGDVADEQTRLNLTQQLFSGQYARAVVAALQNQGETWKENVEVMYAAGDAFDGYGRAQEMVIAQSRTLSNALKRIKIGFEDVFITLWQGLSSANLDFFYTLSDHVENFARSLRPGGELHGALQTITNLVLEVANNVFPLLWEAIDIVLRGASKLLTAFNPLINILSNVLGRAAATATRSLEGFFTNITNIFSVISFLVESISSLVEAFFYLYDAISGVVDVGILILQVAFDGLLDVILIVVNVVGQVLAKVFNVLAAVIKMVASDMQLLFPLLAMIVTKLVALKVAGVITNYFTLLKNAVIALKQAFIAKKLTIAGLGLTGLAAGLAGVKAAVLALWGALVANPWVALATAIAGVTAALAVFITRSFQASDATLAMRAAIREVNDETRNFIESSQRARDAFDEQIRETEGATRANTEMINSLVQLANQQDITAGETYRMQGYMEHLNRAIPGLNVTFDTVTGSLTATAEAMHALNEHAGLGRMLEQMGNMRIQLASQQTEEEYRLANAVDAVTLARSEQMAAFRREQERGLLGYMIGGLFGQADIRDATAALEEAEGYLARLREEMDLNEQQAAALSEAITIKSEAYAAGSELVEQFVEEMARMNSAVVVIQDTFKEVFDDMTDIFADAATSSESSAQSIIDALDDIAYNAEQMIEKWEAFGGMVQWLEDEVAQGNLDRVFADQLISMGVGGLHILEELYNDTTGLLDDMADAFGNAFELSTDLSLAELGVLDQGVEEALNTIATNMERSAAAQNIGANIVGTIFDTAVDSITADKLADLGYALDSGMEEALHNAEGALNAAGLYMEEILDAMADAAEISSPSGVTMRFGASLVEGLMEGIATAKATAVGAAKALMSELLNTFTDTAIDVSGFITNLKDTFAQYISSAGFESVGEAILDGVREGINRGAPRLRNTLRDLSQNLLRETKQALEISSPSRMFANQIGEPISEGVAAGIERAGWRPALSLQRTMEKVVDESTGRGRRDVSHRAAYNGEQVGKAAVDGVARGVERNQRRAVAAMGTVTGEMLEAAMGWINEFRASSDWTFEEELKMWKELEEAHKSARERMTDEERFAADVRNALERSSFEHSRAWIEERTRLEELSLAEIVAAWERVAQRYEEGSEMRIEADRRVFDARRDLLREQERLADEHARVMDRMMAAEQRYQDAVINRTRAIQGDMFATPSDRTVDREDLLLNKQAQRDMLRGLERNLRILTERGIDEGFIQALREQGPKVAAEVEALVDMSSYEMNDFVAMWQENYERSRRLAIEELRPLRQETLEEIDLLIKESRELGEREMYLAGSAFSQGLADGILSNIDAAQNATYTLCRAIVNTANQSLEISSPSRVARYIGEMFSFGFALGIDDKARLVKEKVKDLCEYLHEMIEPEVRELFGDGVTSSFDVDIKSNLLTAALNKLTDSVNKLTTQLPELHRSAATSPATQTAVAGGPLIGQIVVEMVGDEEDDYERAREFGRITGEEIERELRARGIVLPHGTLFR